jgi:hypothetical protein
VTRNARKSAAVRADRPDRVEAGIGRELVIDIRAIIC